MANSPRIPPLKRRPRKYGKTGRYRASNPAEDDMPRPSDVAHASNAQGTHFLPPSTAAMTSARLVAGIPPARRSGALGLTRFWTYTGLCTPGNSRICADVAEPEVRCLHMDG